MIPKIVIDASVALKWYLDEEYSVDADRLSQAFLSQQIDIISPVILKLEVMNGLLSATVSKRLSFNDAKKHINSFMNLELKEIPMQDEALCQNIFELAKNYKLSVYDSSYITLAKFEGCDFYTADRKLYTNLHKDKNFVKWIEEFK